MLQFIQLGQTDDHDEAKPFTLLARGDNGRLDDQVPRPYYRNRTHYGLLLEKYERSRLLIWVLAYALVLVLVMLIGWVYYVCKLKRNEQHLYNLYNKKLSFHREHQWHMLQKVELKGQDELSSSEKLYMDLCSLMDRDRPYIRPEFNRNLLARELHTNRTYLAKAISTYAKGMSISEFITLYRLQYAASLLVGRLDLPIKDIVFMSGFNSYSTFVRLFRRFYGVTPTVFRVNAQEITGLEPIEGVGQNPL